MIEKNERYQFPLHGEAASNYLDLVIQQRTGRKIRGHSIVDVNFTLTSSEDIENIIFQ